MNLLRLSIIVLILSCGVTHSSRFYFLKESPHRQGNFDYIAKIIGHSKVTFDKSIPNEFKKELNPLLDQLNAYLLKKSNLTENLDLKSVGESGEPELYVGIQDINVTQRYFEEDPLKKNENKDLILNIKEASKDWKSKFKAEMKAIEKSHYLIMKIAIRKYWIKEEGLIGKKHIELGYMNRLNVPIVNDKKIPIEVLQLQCQLISSEGEILRSLAEAISPNYDLEKNNISKLNEKIDLQFCKDIPNLEFIDQHPGNKRWEIAVNNALAQIVGRKDLLKKGSR